jgi:hypothetical protein
VHRCDLEPFVFAEMRWKERLVAENRTSDVEFLFGATNRGSIGSHHDVMRYMKLQIEQDELEKVRPSPRILLLFNSKSRLNKDINYKIRSSQIPQG